MQKLFLAHTFSFFLPILHVYNSFLESRFGVLERRKITPAPKVSTALSFKKLSSFSNSGKRSVV